MNVVNVEKGNEKLFRERASFFQNYMDRMKTSNEQLQVNKTNIPFSISALTEDPKAKSLADIVNNSENTSSMNPILGMINATISGVDQQKAVEFLNTCCSTFEHLKSWNSNLVREAIGQSLRQEDSIKGVNRS